MLTRQKKAVLHSVVFALCNCTALAGAASEFMYQGDATPTAVSGASGAEHTLEMNGPKAIKTIEWSERRDHPCLIEIWGRNLNNVALEQTESHTECGSSASANSRVVGFPKPESQAYIAGVSVCMNNDGTRVKGIQVRGRVPGAGGRLTDTPNEPQKDYPNCRDWRRWVDCPEGRLASGVVLQFEKGQQPKSLTGLRLLCRTVAVRAIVDTPPQLTGATSSLDEVSGLRGELIELKPAGGSSYGLDTIFWGERRDNPCVVRAEGRDLEERNRRATRQVNKCSGDTGENSRIDLTVRDEVANAFISGLRVCMNNGRVKGVQIEVRPVPWSEGDPPEPKSAPAIDDHTGWQLNCLLSQDWRQWVRCPRGQIAVGVKAYFEREGSNPRSLTGLGLFCRAYDWQHGV